MAIHRGTIVSFDSGTYLATVRLDGGTPGVVEGVRCTRLADAEFTPGRRVLLDTGDDGDLRDAVITAVYT